MRRRRWDRGGGGVTDLLLQPTENPSQYEVIADEHVVGRIALFRALETADLGYGRSILPLRMVAIRRTASRRRATPRCRLSPLLVPENKTESQVAH